MIVTLKSDYKISTHVWLVLSDYYQRLKSANQLQDTDSLRIIDLKTLDPGFIDISTRIVNLHNTNWIITPPCIQIVGERYDVKKLLKVIRSSVVESSEVLLFKDEYDWPWYKTIAEVFPLYVAKKFSFRFKSFGKEIGPDIKIHFDVPEDVDAKKFYTSTVQYDTKLQAAMLNVLLACSNADEHMKDLPWYKQAKELDSLGMVELSDYETLNGYVFVNNPDTWVKALKLVKEIMDMEVKL